MPRRRLAKASAAKMAYSAVDPELDEFPAYYEVEITSQGGEEFEYKLDAYTGAILESKREAEDGTETPAVQPSDPSRPQQCRASAMPRRNLLP